LSRVLPDCGAAHLHPGYGSQTRLAVTHELHRRVARMQRSGIRGLFTELAGDIGFYRPVMWQ